MNKDYYLCIFVGGNSVIFIFQLCIYYLLKYILE